MSLNEGQLIKHCETIMESRRILNKIVVLCEGDVREFQDRESPQTYRKMEQTPDSNFYKACVPSWWQQKQPQFFNCGDRNDVVNTYFMLLNLNDKNSNESYLNSQKLFAIVDLDIQTQKIDDNYPFSNTESIFNDIYEKSKINVEKAKRHHIWVTGFVHKESYFLIPELQALFDNYHTFPIYNGESLKLENIYFDMSDSISEDIDLKDNLKRACRRINYCVKLDCSDVEKLKSSWQIQFQKVKDNRQKNELISALLTVKKAKSHWNEIEPKSYDSWKIEPDKFREQLALEIGRFYSQQGKNSEYHIPVFLKTLYQFA